VVKLNATQRASEEGGSAVPLQCGMIVACFLPKYKDEIPQIGKVIDICTASPEHIEIEWQTGSFSSSWKVCKLREGRRCVPWTESIQQKDIIYYPIELTNSCKLRKKTVTELQLAYSSLL